MVTLRMQIPASFSPKQRALIERLRGAGASTSASPVTRLPPGSPVQLSSAQPRLWVLEQIRPGTPLYNVPFALRLQGPLDAGSLDRAMVEVLRRHEALRTVFPEGNGEPAPQITATPLSRLAIPDLSLMPEEERSTTIAEMLGNEAVQAFQLSQGPLLRALLLRLGPESHLLAITMHHIVCDAWSMPVLLKELSSLYETFVNGRASALAELPVQYADYAAWQRCRLMGERLDQDLSYWRGSLRRGSRILQIPPDPAPPPPGGWGRGALSLPLCAEN